MKKIIGTLAAMALIISVSAQNLKVDTKSSTVKWKGEQVTHSHWGWINITEGSLKMKGNDLVGGEFVIDMNSIDAADQEGEWKEKLESHLKSDDFFGVKKYPTAKLIIKNAVKNGDTYKITADATVKGITEEINFDAKVAMEGNKVVATGMVTINRAKHNVTYKSSSFFDSLGDKLIYDDFTLDVKVVASK